jgi:hypothetical protein
MSVREHERLADFRERDPSAFVEATRASISPHFPFE